MAVQNRFNPISEMLGSQTWDGIDRLPQVFSILGIDTNPADGVNISQTLIRKWLLQCLSLALQNGEPAYGADGVLVLTGAQGIGKTTFFRKLAMHPNLFLEGATLDANNKDSKIEATSVWLCELGEIESTFRRDVDKLKAFITSASDTYRVPYGRTSESTTRRTSFRATANSSEYLVDKTGNRRFWTIAVDNVDLTQLMELDVMQLWLQIWQELNAKGQQCFRLTKTEQSTLANRNMEHEKPLPAQEEIEDLFYRAESDAPEDEHYKLAQITITQFKTQHEALSKCSSQQIKAALMKMGRMNEKKIKGTRLVELPILI